MEWIKSSNELPPENEFVVTFGKGGVGLDRITYPKDGNLWACTNLDCVTHWCRIPEWPEE